MSVSVEQLKKAVANLPKDELREFRSWYEAFDAEAWDKQLEQDVINGKLDHLAEKAILDYKISDQ